MVDKAELTDEEAETMWGWIVQAIDEATLRMQNPSNLYVAPNSQLAKDDARSDPYQVSHCVQTCLNAGIDHLHAARTLMFHPHEPVLHANADWSLIRGALENFAAGFWVIHPPQRTYRVEHALRWMVKNFKDQGKATEDLDLPNTKPTADKVDKVVDVGRRAGCNVKQIRGSYLSTTALEYVDRYSHTTNPHLMWQLCSGFAHGRPWASHSMNEMEIQSVSENGVHTVKFTSDYKRLLAAAWPASELMRAVDYLYTLRAST
jgi:hypothetical protein